MKKYICSIAIAMFGVFITSCSNDDNLNDSKPVEERKGRFDRSPFSWDVKGSAEVNDLLFIDDTNYSVNTSGEHYSTSNDLYPGAVFPKNSIDRLTFDAMVKAEKNPYDLMFMFYKSFVLSDISTKKERVTYLDAVNQALDSEAFQSEVKNRAYGIEDLYITECYTYKDVVQAFSGNLKLGEVFAKNMKMNAGDSRYKSILLMRVGKVFYGEWFEGDYENFFKEPMNEKDLYYVKRIMRGTPVTYVAIESKADYADLNDAVRSALVHYRKEGNLNLNDKNGKILSNASFTILSTEDKINSLGKWSTSKDDMFSVLKNNLSANYIGQPIYLEIRSVDTDKRY
ncbi:hypothetical protein E0Z07_05150 [Myroides odoratimimus]|uniref:hypothetical protein n=1 Tax=Myroides odoratimimus TaxID=76832 RepID=UPI001040A95F|nr:hypothetical protein [Myroides odoratimimus]QBK75750.1 hypothetical protein E0Z07_05150 [Myroides odoratimimus]